MAYAFPLLVVLGLLALLQHFWMSLAWGGLLAVILAPVILKLQARGWSAGAAVSAVTLGLLVGFGLPAIVIIQSLKPEVAALTGYLQQLNRTGLPAPDWLDSLPVFAGLAREWWEAHLMEPGAVLRVLGQLPDASIKQLTSTLGGVGAAVAANGFYIFLALLTFVVLSLNLRAATETLDAAGGRYFPQAYAVVRRLLPLSVRGTALGLCSVAALEGVVLGVAYVLAGAPMPLLLGVLTGYLALIPGGAPFSFVAVSLLLLAKGSTAAAVGLAIWGTVELFLVDKFVRPRLIGHSVNLPFLAVLFGLIGGVSTLGVVGLFVGPFLMALLFHFLRDSSKLERENGQG